MEAAISGSGALSPGEEDARQLLRASVRRSLTGLESADDGRLQRLMLLDYLLGDLPALVADQAESPRPAPRAVASERAPEAPGEVGVFRISATSGGGVVQTPGGVQITLPERVVLAARMADGDQIRLEPDGTLPDGSPRYFFRNLTARDPHYQVTGFAVAEGPEVYVRAGDARHALAPEDAERWGVRPGDVLTVGFQDGGRIRVLRVHPVDPLAPAPLGVRPSTHRRLPRPGPKRSAVSGSRLRASARVALIGGHDANRPYYRRIFAALGADLDFLPGGTYPRHRVEDLVDRADAVILLPQCAGHEMISVAKDRAKARGVLLITGQTENWSGLLLQVRRDIVPRLESGVDAAGASAAQ